METSFELLEEKVRKAADLVKRLRKENKDLQEDLGRLRPRLLEAEKRMEAVEKQRGASAEEARQVEALKQEIQGLRQEREDVRRRIAKLVEVLEAVEA